MYIYRRGHVPQGTTSGASRRDAGFHHCGQGMESLWTIGDAEMVLLSGVQALLECDFRGNECIYWICVGYNHQGWYHGARAVRAKSSTTPIQSYPQLDGVVHGYTQVIHIGRHYCLPMWPCRGGMGHFSRGIGGLAAYQRLRDRPRRCRCWLVVRSLVHALLNCHDCASHRIVLDG